MYTLALRILGAALGCLVFSGLESFFRMSSILGEFVEPQGGFPFSPDEGQTFENGLFSGKKGHHGGTCEGSDSGGERLVFAEVG